MITLDTRLAQEIVTRTMKIIPFNVNVMDARGTIIGSGERARIGELHAGAQLAIAQKRTVEVDTGAMRAMAGARPGVNLLLTVRGEICGVVGLTGDPEAVRQFGELVRMTAEMILEQDQLNRDLLRDARYREEFVLQWLAGGAGQDGSLANWAGRLGIDLELPRSALVLILDAGVEPDKALSSLQHLKQRLASAHRDCLCASRSARELVILMPVADPQAGERRFSALSSWFAQECRHDFRLAMGVALGGVEAVAHSYQSALACLQVGLARKLNKPALSYYDLRLPVLLSGLGAGWQADQLRLPLRRLEAADKRGALRATLSAWFDANGHLSATALKLHIHRNTLDYRLRQIAEITGLDLGRTDERLLLYVALQLE